MASGGNNLPINNSIVLGERLLCQVIESANGSDATKKKKGSQPNENSDIVRIICRYGEEKHVHRIVLNAVSPYFRSLFKNGRQVVETIRLDIQAKVIDYILSFIHSIGEVNLEPRFILETYAAAKYLEIDEMAETILSSINPSFMEDFVESENCFDEVKDGDMKYLSDMLVVDLSSEQKFRLMAKINRWSASNTLRKMTASKLNETILSHEGPKMPVTPDQTSKSHFIALTVTTTAKNVLTIYRFYNAGVFSREVLRNFEFPEQITDSQINAAVRGNYFIIIVKGYLYLYLMESKKSSETSMNNLVPQTYTGHSLKGLTASGISLFVWDLSWVYAVNYHPKFEIKPIMKLQRISNVFGLNAKNETGPQLAVETPDKRGVHFYKDNGEDSNLELKLDSYNILAVSEEYVLQNFEGTLIINEHNYKRVTSTKRVVLEGEILEAEIKKDCFFVKIIYFNRARVMISVSRNGIQHRENFFGKMINFIPVT